MLPQNYFSSRRSNAGHDSSSREYASARPSSSSRDYASIRPSSSSRDYSSRPSTSSSRDVYGASRDPYSRGPYDLHGIGLHSSSSRSSRNPMPHLTERLHEPRAGSFSRVYSADPRSSTSSDRRAYDDPAYIGPGYGSSPSPRQSPYEPVRRRSNSEARQYLPNRNPSYFEVRQPFRDLYSSNSGQREYYSGTGATSSYAVGGATSRRPSDYNSPSVRRPGDYTTSSRRPWH